MERFSQREGFKPIKDTLQIESMDDDLRNSLWNALSIYHWQNTSFDYKPFYYFISRLWINYFKNLIDEMPEYWSQTIDIIRKYFFKCEWYSVFDLIEFVANDEYDTKKNKVFMYYCNSVLEEELSVWRFVGGKITKISSEEEIEEVEGALSLSSPFASVREHIKSALELIADRKSPDYRNAIKESISAVESACKIVTTDKSATLGQVLKKLEKNIDLHPALKSGFDKLYGYTSSADGIRHALMEQSNLSFEDAKFFLVACSAFCNYLIAKADKLGFKP